MVPNLKWPVGLILPHFTFDLSYPVFIIDQWSAVLSVLFCLFTFYCQNHLCTISIFNRLYYLLKCPVKTNVCLINYNSHSTLKLLHERQAMMAEWCKCLGPSFASGSKFKICSHRRKFSPFFIFI